MGTVKAMIGVVLIAAAVYTAVQIVPPELSNYSFQDDLRNIALSIGANPHTTDQVLIEEVMRKAGEHQIALFSEQVPTQSITFFGATALYLARHNPPPAADRPA